jgi:hypothetical protein
MHRLAHRWLFYLAALLYVAQQYRVHTLSPLEYVSITGSVWSLVFYSLLLLAMVYVLVMTIVCLAHLLKNTDPHKLQWALFILGLPIVGAYVYLEMRMFGDPNASQAPADTEGSGTGGSASRTTGRLSSAAFAVATIVTCVLVALLGLRILFETADPLLLSGRWADIYQEVFGPTKILYLLGVILSVVALVKGWPHRGLLKVSMVMFGLVFWAYLGMMWWVQFKPSEVMGVVIVEHGLYTIEDEGKPTAHHVCINQTDSVQARIGTMFGIRYMVLGRPAGGRATVTLLWKFPEPGVWDSTRGSFQRSLVQPSEDLIGYSNTSVYVFETPYELLPGEWSVLVRDEHGDVGEARFVVRKP